MIPSISVLLPFLGVLLTRIASWNGLDASREVTEAQLGEFPYIILMKVLLSDRINHITSTEKSPCIGVLISSQYVLAGAACVSAFDEKIDDVYPIINADAFNTKSTGYKVEKKILHRELKLIEQAGIWYPGKNSIGLLKLVKPLQLDKNIAPIGIAVNAPKESQNFTIPIWKKGGNSNESKALHHVRREAYNLVACVKKYPNSYFEEQGHKMLCTAPFPHESDGFRGPLIRRGKAGESDILVGVFSLSLLGTPGSLDSLPVYTSIGEFHEWITSNVPLESTTTEAFEPSTTKAPGSTHPTNITSRSPLNTSPMPNKTSTTTTLAPHTTSTTKDTKSTITMTF